VHTVLRGEKTVGSALPTGNIGDLQAEHQR
jgi:hypothetical protein